MVETEVESILREIRERVLYQQRAGQDVAVSAAASSAIGNAANGGNGADASGIARPGDSETVVAEKLALINSYLTTTARAWDRLPPVVSNRSGLTARLELWLKRHLKRATRWYAWEQVNFNAAVHQALRDMLPLLSAYEQELRKLQAKVAAEAELRRVEFEQHHAEIAAQRAEFRAEITKIHAEIEAQQTATEAQRTATETQRAATDAKTVELNSRVAELVSELRERDGRLEDQQRVCFKQLSLETSEAAVLEDRARRKTEALLQELSRRVEQLEEK